MQRPIVVVLLTSLLVFNFPSALAQRKSNKNQKTAPASLATERGADNITAAQIREYLTFIASDVFEGRDTPSRGLDTAAQFLAMNVSRWGLKPAGDEGTFFQKIALRKASIDKAETRVQMNNQTITWGDDFLPIARPANVPASQLVFAGSGWFIKSKNIDAYKGIDAKGKIAIVFAPIEGPPRGVTRADISGQRGEDWMGPAEYAFKQGAVGIVIVPDFQYLANWESNQIRQSERVITTVEKFPAASTQLSSGIVASPRLANLLFQGEKQSAAQIYEAAFGGQPLEPFVLSAQKTLSINIKLKSEVAATQNVVAVFEGSDPVLKNEYVALGAHYDHLGVGTPVNGDAIYNGADDDGSGTIALLAMAEALAKARSRPKRSVLFVWHAGEEKGNWGSRYFTEYPTIPLDRIVTQINLDMIGRSKKQGDTNPRNSRLSGPNEIFVIGPKMMSTELAELTERVNKQYLNLTYDFRYDEPNDSNRYFSRSDQYSYALKGIPVVFFLAGEHEDYHRPSDSPDKIDYQKMEKVSRTIYMTLWEIADQATRPKVDKPPPM
jgi:hypothetical protein